MCVFVDGFRARGLVGRGRAFSLSFCVVGVDVIGVGSEVRFRPTVGIYFVGVNLLCGRYSWVRGFDAVPII